MHGVGGRVAPHARSVMRRSELDARNRISALRDFENRFTFVITSLKSYRFTTSANLGEFKVTKIQINRMKLKEFGTESDCAYFGLIQVLSRELSSFFARFSSKKRVHLCIPIFHDLRERPAVIAHRKDATGDFPS